MVENKVRKWSRNQILQGVISHSKELIFYSESMEKTMVFHWLLPSSESHFCSCHVENSLYRARVEAEDQQERMSNPDELSYHLPFAEFTRILMAIPIWLLVLTVLFKVCFNSSSSVQYGCCCPKLVFCLYLTFAYNACRQGGYRKMHLLQEAKQRRVYTATGEWVRPKEEVGRLHGNTAGSMATYDFC